MALKEESGKIRFWTPLRLVSTVMVLGMVAAFGASSCNSNDPPVTAGTATSSKPGSGAPSKSATGAPFGAAPSSVTVAQSIPTVPAVVLDTELKSTKGQPIKLSTYSGKVLVVNLWATWCGPCRRETPELVKLYNEYQDRGVEMVGLSTEDPIASARSVENFVREFNVGYRVGWATREVALALMQGRGSIPQSFVIGRDGRIKKRFIGFLPQETPPLLKQAIEDALTATGKS